MSLFSLYAHTESALHSYTKDRYIVTKRFSPWTGFPQKACLLSLHFSWNHLHCRLCGRTYPKEEMEEKQQKMRFLEIGLFDMMVAVIHLQKKSFNINN